MTSRRGARCSMPTSSARPAAFLEVTELSAGYGGAPIVQHASAAAGLGEIVTIVGPNGAGKSTLLKAVVGMIPAMTGSVTLGGEDITNKTADQLASRGDGNVHQDNDVYEHLNMVVNM